MVRPEELTKNEPLLWSAGNGTDVWDLLCACAAGDVAATGIARALTVLVSYGDFDTATAVLSADPSLAEDPDALAAAARSGHEPIVRLILQHRPRVVQRVAVAAKSRALTELLFQSGMNPNLPGWLGVTPLHGAAESAYMRAEYIDYTAREKPEAEQAQARKRAGEGFALARKYADDAFALARNHQQAAQDDDVIYRAETVLGVLALKGGDRDAAVEHMRTAGAAPMSDAGRGAARFGLRGRLVEYLLRAGERASVAEYLEKSAERDLPGRDRLLKDAAQIRAGVMPLSYQYAEARR